MNLEFKKLKAEDMRMLAPYFSLRPNKTCDSGFLDSFLWSDYYQVEYCCVDQKAFCGKWNLKEKFILQCHFVKKKT